MKKTAALIALLGVSAACSSAPAELAGYTRTPAPHTADLSLPDASAGGEPFFLKAPEGNLLLVYLGYTACPDVCPTTLADIRTALADLGDAAGRVELAMITVDPQRDTGEILAGYVQSFVPDAHALRTEDDDLLSAVAFVLGAAYQVDVDDEGAVEVAHTAHIYVIDGRGDLVVTWPFGIDKADMTSDLRILLDGS
ncbi:MAG: SCO family protein [Actinobacteria bacterium]|nr:SCO family protein [Actinomycetota bacterium]MBU1494704.1 SCO family protein [Actinomycetota bacterium]MBU1865847.1 SCO family protein [Actinomycetota bacterium]